MAIQKTYTLSDKNITVNDAYFKVSWISGNNEGFHVDLELKSDASSAPIEVISFNVPGAFIAKSGNNDKNWIRQVYRRLKTSSIVDTKGVVHNFTDATDV